MADTKISALPSGAPAQAGDEYVIARGGANYKLTGTNLLGLVTGTANTFTATQTFGTANVTTLNASNLRALDGTPAATVANSTGVISVSTKIEYADGTAAAPTVTNTGDTDTGMYFPAANEVAVAAGGSVAAAFNSNGVFFRNRIINGDMRIDQRNAGASLTPTNLQYSIDRWKCYLTQASKYSVQQNSGAVTPPSGFTNYLGAVSLSSYSVAATDTFLLSQLIEGNNISDLGFGTAAASTVTLSFWVRSSLTGTFGANLSNSDFSRNYPFTYTISSANTWERKSIVIAGDTTGTWQTTTAAGLIVSFNLGTGSTYSGTAGAWSSSLFYSATGATSVVGTNGATFYITGVQLETGSVATPFERRPFGTELMLCQRYYEKSYDYATAAGSAVAEGYSAMDNPEQTTALYVFNVDVFKVTKRAAANMRFWDLVGNLSRITDFTLGGLARTDNRNTVYLYTGNVQNARMINLQSASTAGTYQWDASAEL